MLACLAAPAAAQPVWNLGNTPAPMRSGPDAYGPVRGVLQPGEAARITRCDWSGRWCQISTDRVVGWVDMDAVPLGRNAPRPVAPAPGITVTPLPGTGAPLPRVILDAVPDDPRLERVPGARAPLMLSMTAPMRNVTGGLVNLRAGPGTDRAIVGQLQPGAGGPIETCDPTEQWCRLRTPTGSGWVKMTLVGAARHVITAR